MRHYLIVIAATLAFSTLPVSAIGAERAEPAFATKVVDVANPPVGSDVVFTLTLSTAADLSQATNVSGFGFCHDHQQQHAGGTSKRADQHPGTPPQERESLIWPMRCLHAIGC